MTLRPLIISVDCCILSIDFTQKVLRGKRRLKAT
jgi:hypothetical protein